MLFAVQTLARLAAISLTGAVVIFGPVSGAIAQTLKGAGASFPAPLYQRYFSEYQKATGITVKYSSVGSGEGIRQFTDGIVDFGATDVPPSSSEKSQMTKGVVLVPTAGGAVAVVYNLPGVSNLKISRRVLGKIFTGEIDNWREVDSKLPNKRA